MNNNVPVEINKNIKDITYHILCSNIKLKDETKNKIKMIYNKNNTKIEKKAVLEDMLKWLTKGRADDENY